MNAADHTGLTGAAPHTAPVLLDMQGIGKSFAGVPALQSVNWSVRAGEIHAIVGENGAGKSTLMKVLSGVYPYASYEGTIVFDGQWQCFEGIRDSEAQGIIIIHQEMALVPTLSVAENLFLGHERARAGVIDVAATHQRAAHWLARVGLAERLQHRPAELSGGERQRVALARALVTEPACVLADEPTGNLDRASADAVFELMLSLARERGTAFVLVTHDRSLAARCDRQMQLLAGRLSDLPL